MNRETTVIPAVYMAECQECGWMSGWSRNAMGLAAQHHDRTRHLVRVGVDRAVYFGPWPERQSVEAAAANLTFEIEA